MNITVKALQDALKKLDCPLFKGDYNLNLIGVRSKDIDANTFNDVLCVLFQLAGKWQLFTFDITTDPGVYYRENPINVKGTAVLAPGHYAKCWQIGAHRNLYHALVQRGPMTVFRDADGESDIDLDGGMEAGLFGINLHRASTVHKSIEVDRWSAGCQVMADPVDFDLVMALVKKSVQLYGNGLSYTLLTEDQL